MKAFVRTNPQTQDVQLKEVPVPEINEVEVLVKVEAFGVGIHDRYFIPQGIHFPYVIGSEGAGVIIETGKDVSGFSVGDRVIFTTILQVKGGSWAEYAVANASSLIHLPANLSFEQGATVPIAGNTALECIRELDLTVNDTLFIAGASGAIGTLVIQMAAEEGARISGSASERNHEHMRSLGLEKAVDYHDSKWINQVINWSVGGVNAALAIQPGTGSDSIKVVKDGGLLITVSGDSDQVKPERNIIIRQMSHQIKTPEKTIEFVNKISEGKINIVIEKEYAFEDALEALEKTETRHARGKLVVKRLGS